MMPEGVEHTVTTTAGGYLIPVTDSMMPEGVEHFLAKMKASTKPT